MNRHLKSHTKCPLSLLVFAFAYVAAISQFCVAAQKEGRPTTSVIRNSTILLTVFTMFFV